MFCSDKIRDLIVINPMQSYDECVMVKCGYFDTVAVGVSPEERQWTCTIGAVLDFDVKLVFRPTTLLPREKMVLQMFQCEPWINGVMEYLKNHHMVVDITKHSYGFLTVLLNSEKEVTVEDLCGRDLSHYRNSYTNVDGYFDGMSMVSIPNIILKPIHNCLYLHHTSPHPLDKHPEYRMIKQAQFEKREINQILIWLIGLREFYRKHCLNSQDEGYVVLTRDIVQLLHHAVSSDRTEFLFYSKKNQRVMRRLRQNVSQKRSV